MKKLLLLLLLFVSNCIFGQFSESFEGGTIPAGWTVLAGGDTEETWHVSDYSSSTNSSQAQNGTKAFTISFSSDAHDDYLITPQFTVTAGISDKLTFWGKNANNFYPETIAVKASTTMPTALAMTTVLAESIAPEISSAYVKYTIDLTSLVGQSIYIGFHSTTTDMSSFHVDNVVVGSTLSCIEPLSGLTFSELTTNSAVATWTAANPEPVAGNDVYISTSGTAPTAASVPTSTVTSGTSITFSGLTESTLYYVYIRSKCSATTGSVWGHLGTFLTVTVFAPVTPPYAWGFDNYTFYQEHGWTLSDTGEYWTSFYDETAQSSDGMIGSTNQEYQINKWVFSRAISLQANSINTIKFYIKNYQANLPQSLKLTVGSTPTNADQTTTLYSTTTFANTTWTLVTATYTPTEAGVYYFGFNHFSPAQTQNVLLALDTFSISSVLSNGEFKLNKFSVFPNPAIDVLNVKPNEYETVDSIEIFDINGRKILTKFFDNGSDAHINVSSLSAGMYIIHITSGNKSVIKKFLKQ
ncbi:choice-of-anchor J domain-containing protein [Flavobacterium sp. SM2513]|uniref:choice-of-anchor J domain-containing protein n=1 Tax=Flavobacterium sp. SM2513 TaxID=3424766 RepID=UPI003D7F9156